MEIFSCVAYRTKIFYMIKKFRIALCALSLMSFVLVSCSGGETKTTTTDTTTVKADTTALDSASTRPVKSPD
jgi:uncharacterized protein YcfL